MKLILLNLLFLISISAHAVIGGIEIKQELSPQLVRLEITKANNKSGICTGSYIARNMILTAAHCFLEVPIKIQSSQSIRVRFGITRALKHTQIKERTVLMDAHAIKQISSIKDIASKNIEKFTPHDFAIILLDGYETSEHFFPITKQPSISSQSFTVMGFGNNIIEDSVRNKTTIQSGRGGSGVLRQGRLNLSVSSNRAVLFSTNNYYSKHTIRDYFYSLFVSKSNQTSRGDSGAPLLNDKLQIVGIVSGGNNYFNKQKLIYKKNSFFLAATNMNFQTLLKQVGIQ